MYSAAAAENSLDISGAVIDSQCLSMCVYVKGKGSGTQTHAFKHASAQGHVLL